MTTPAHQHTMAAAWPSTPAMLESKPSHSIDRAPTSRPTSAPTPTDDKSIDLLHRLVSTPSVSGHERPAVELFTQLASQLGLQSSIDGAGNGLALRPAGGPELARIILLGHIDTVPGHIPVRIEDNVLHGRGSVDAKGALATMLIAASQTTPHHGVALEVIGAVGEETAGSPGARFLSTRRAPAACIIAEPSGWDGVTLGYKGRLRVTLDLTGPCGHSAGPDASACDLATAWWEGVRCLVEALNAGHSGVFNTITSSILSITSSDDGLHQSVRLAAGFRLPTWITPETLERKLPALSPPTIPPAFSGRLHFEARELAHASDRNDPVARALSAAIRQHNGTPRPKLKTGTSDMNVVAPHWRCPIAAYGPGDSRLDHTPDERLDLAEYLTAIAVLRDALRTLSGELVPPPCQQPRL